MFWDNVVSHFFLEVLALENEDTMLPLKHRDLITNWHSVIPEEENPEITLVDT